MLNRQEFWKRVKALEGKTIESLTNKRRNKIIRVTDIAVFTEERMSPIRFNGEHGLYTNYEKLHQDGFLYIGFEEWGRWKWIWAIFKYVHHSRSRS